MADSFAHRAPLTLLVALSALALALDYVDGWIARRTATTATLGARFDGEVDAFLILVLSVYVARSAGAWVLAIGAARYAFLAAGRPLPWLRAPLPPRHWRKVVAATLGIVLTIAAAGVLPRSLTQAALLAALALVGESFGRDVWWLWTHRHASQSGMSVSADAAVEPASVHRPGWGRLRASIAAAFTLLALLIVWAAFVAPDRPEDLTLTAFLRVPLDGLALIAVAVLLPRTPRRILAAVAGPILGLVVILKILDIGFFTAFARPFDPVGDLGSVGIGIETLSDAIGRSQADLLVGGGVALGVAVLVLTTLALLRLMRVAAENRRSSLAGGHGARRRRGALCGLRSTSSLRYPRRLHERRQLHRPRGPRPVQADIHDAAVFAVRSASTVSGTPRETSC